MKIRSEGIAIEVIDEPGYSHGSADNVRPYALEVDLAKDGYRNSSHHGVVINGDPVVLFSAGAGATSVHDCSAIFLEGCLYLAVGNRVVCFEVDARKVRWSLLVDSATCFGVYYSSANDALISHGEMEISRFTRDGGVMWRSGGADIFSEGFELKADCVETVDFNGKHYCFDYESGVEIQAS